jgi:glycosyltransferase involved in cell wall biosynthesis
LSRLGVKKQVFNSLESKPFSIVSCSNVIPLKRVELIAQALKLIALPYTWTHFGDGPLLENIKAEFQNEHHLFQGRVSNTEVLTFYQKHTPHLFINVSSSEGIPVSIMEAFSFGISVIATDVGGNGEIVNGKNGTLVPADISAEELSEIIQEYIEMNNESYKKKRLAAYKTWEEGFNAGKNYGEFVELLMNSLA